MKQMQPGNCDFLMDYNNRLLKENNNLKINVKLVFSGKTDLKEWASDEFSLEKCN